ncbi:MAG TPA: hypothetical protein VM221_05435 [Armatimonadota bacterium]|nr:hypothetical protein [Armatimonadota bacterium]
MSSVAAQAGGYMALAGAAAAMAVGAAGLFSTRLRSVVVYSAVLQAGYAGVGVAAGLLAKQSGGYSAAMFQVIAGAAGVGLMWVATRAIGAHTGEPPAPESTPQVWCVFCLALSCMSLVGLPPLAGLPAKVAIIHAGLRNPLALFVVTIGAAALGVVSLWAYASIVLPMVLGRASADRPVVGRGLRAAVDALVAVLVALGLVPYIGFAIGAAVAGGP